MIINLLLKKFEDSLQRGYLSTYVRPELKKYILNHMKTLKYSITLIHKLHLATFYWRGHHYHISKRLTGINYVSKFLKYIFILKFS